MAEGRVSGKQQPSYAAQLPTPIRPIRATRCQILTAATRLSLASVKRSPARQIPGGRDKHVPIFAPAVRPVISDTDSTRANEGTRAAPRVTSATGSRDIAACIGARAAI